MRRINKKYHTLHTLCNMDDASRFETCSTTQKDLILTLVDVAKMIFNGYVELHHLSLLTNINTPTYSATSVNSELTYLLAKNHLKKDLWVSYLSL